MPSLGSHLASAYGLADRLGHPYIDADRGAYYLGSTAPDIRVLLRVDRRLTHFFELDEFERQDSVARMFEEHPQLRDAASLNESTRAFVAGFVFCWCPGRPIRPPACGETCSAPTLRLTWSISPSCD